jgi:hypothetical protein
MALAPVVAVLLAATVLVLPVPGVRRFRDPRPAADVTEVTGQARLVC